MLNYEVDPRVLAGFVPPGTELDAWNGRTYVSVVGFLFLDTRVLGWAIPFHRDFEDRVYGATFAEPLAGSPRSAFEAERSDIVVRRGLRI